MANPKSIAPFKFKKGQSGNPQGGRLHDPFTRMIKRLTSAEVAEVGGLIIKKNITALKSIIEDAKMNPDSKHSALKVWISTIAIKGITKGDAHALDVLLNRLIGKVKDRIELTGEEGGSVKMLVGAMTPEERERELKRLRQMREDAGED